MIRIYPASYRLLPVLVLIVFVLSTCEKPERNNPWDTKASTDPVSWAPQNFEADRINVTSVKLSWSSAIQNIEGYRLDRKKGDSEWQVGYYEVPKDVLTWTDEDIVPKQGLIYTYRLYAFAGKNNSASEYLEFDASIPSPSQFKVSVLSPTSVSLSWEYDHSGHEGFKIDKRINEGDWQEEFAVLGVDKYSCIDQEVYLANNLYRYRLYAYAGESTSGKVELYISLPVLSTTQVTSITAVSAQSGGNITDDGGSTVTTRGVVWSTGQNPTLESNQGITFNATGTGSFTSNLSNLQPGTVYYVRAYATNSVGTSYGDQQSFATQDGLPELTTIAVSGINTPTSGGNITSNGGFAITERGVVWSTSQNPTLETNQGITFNGTGTGSFTSNLNNLQPGTVYYVRAYATNSVGTSYGNQVNFTTLNEWDVYNPATGRIWMDRNLGASRVAASSNDTEAYGDLYQWGRGTDGHEKRNSPTTSTLSSSDNPGHGNFITSGGDWRSPQNNNLWQGASSINNPCPPGYRLPTEAEWTEERLSWSSNDQYGAFNSPLKLPLAGSRSPTDGWLSHLGSWGYYWSSTVNGTYARCLSFTQSNTATMYSLRRASGYPVRCIMDE